MSRQKAYNSPLATFEAPASDCLTFVVNRSRLEQCGRIRRLDHRRKLLVHADEKLAETTGDRVLLIGVMYPKRLGLVSLESMRPGPGVRFSISFCFFEVSLFDEF